MTHSVSAGISLTDQEASDMARRVAACLLVLSNANAADAAGGELFAPRTAAGVAVSLPWRAPLSMLIATVGTQLTRLGGADGAGRPTAVEVRHGDGPRILVTAEGIEPSHDAALLAGRVARVLGTGLAVPLGAVDLYSDEDLRIVDGAHRRTVTPERTVPELIRAVAGADPTAVAIEDEARTVGYGELVTAADRYAEVLLDAGVRPGDIVAVGLPRRAELLVALLGVWTAGAAFLPVDTAHPPSRVAALLDAAGVRFAVIADAAALNRPQCRIVPPPGSDLSAAPAPATRAGAPAPAHTDLAYAMSTSGSTGRPKVVGVPHGALAHCVTAFAEQLATATPRVAAATALTFDISLLELFLPLATGGVLLLVGDEVRRDHARLAAHLADATPDLIQATPSGWRLLLPHLPADLTGTTLLCGGEAVTAELAGRLVRTGATVWNVYGPTEATIWCTAHRLRLPLTDPVPIGAPLPGTVARVVGPHGRPLPVGRIGELHVGGPQIAVGYLGEPVRTAEVFADGFYRTGDLCAWRPDGTLAYHGRVDNQVKIRGHRVELGEIETYAERHPAVAQAAAVVVDIAEDDRQLVLYVQVGTGATAPRDADLRAHLAASLPAALMPQRIVALPELPLTTSQKVDRRALRDAAETYINGRRAGSEESL